MKKQLIILTTAALCLVFVFAFMQKPEATTVDTRGADDNPTATLVFSEVQIPWSMTWLPNGDMLVTDRVGKLLRVSGGSLAAEIKGLPEIFVQGQGGLFDVVLHPDYEENGWIYISMASPEGEGKGANTLIIRAQLEHDALVNMETIYKAGPNSTRGQHYGARIAFDEDNYLFFSVGDRGNRDVNPQDIERDMGKIYRLHDDGKVPADNPFVNREDAVKAIYSYGHRNPQGMAMNPETGKIWAHEHGPQGGDELNLIEPGKNYGWPVISFGINYNGTTFTDITEKPGMEQPKTYWDPSIAPSGMTFITSDIYPEWKGKVLVGSLKFGYLVLVTLDGNIVTDKEIVMEGIGRTRDVRQGPDGYIYVAVEGEGIHRLMPDS